MRTLRFAALALFIALAPCAAHAGSNPFAGSWKNAADNQGVVIYATGGALFFDNRQICPTFWARYTLLDPHTAVAVSRQDPRERKTLSLDSEGVLHDSTTAYAYRRTGSADDGVTFKESTARSCGAQHR